MVGKRSKRHSILLLVQQQQKILNQMNQFQYQAENLKVDLENLIQENQKILGEVKSVAIAQAWKILQLAVAKIVQSIENKSKSLAGKDKKEIAMSLLSQFYDAVFIAIDIPLVPSVAESIIHKYTKSFLMILVSSSIDAMVATFREIGIFPSKDYLSAVTVNEVP
jgi:hypothetical protein